MGTWQYERIEGYIKQGADANHVPVYRAWSGKDHFYTANKIEYDNIPSYFKPEGIVFYLANNPIADHVALYRLYKDNDHFYTTSINERDSFVGYGGSNEGILGYVATSNITEHTALYRAYNPGINDHFYTTSAQELINLGTYVPEAGINPEQMSMTRFDPRHHGFLFSNRFELDNPIKIPNCPWMPKKLDPGFCGGMSYAAAKAFCKREYLTSQTVSPQQGDALFNELLLLQLATHPKGIILKTFDWQTSPDLDNDGVGYRTKKAWFNIQSFLDAGNPAVIVVIRKEGYDENVFENHQVLALGYGIYGNTRVLKIYDPNHPKEVGYIVATWGLPRNRLNAHQLPRQNGQRVRGFFLNTTVSMKTLRKSKNYITNLVLN